MSGGAVVAVAGTALDLEVWILLHLVRAAQIRQCEVSRSEGKFVIVLRLHHVMIMVNAEVLLLL